MRPICRVKGFSLVELAIVMVIAALLAGAFLIPLAGQIEARRVKDARAKLAEIEEALLGFAISNGRLPCPASRASQGRESFCKAPLESNKCPPGEEDVTPPPADTGRCSHFLDGYLPASTLGISPVDREGYAVDPWQTETNRWRYAVGGSNKAINGVEYALTTANGMRDATAKAIADEKLLFVCAQGDKTTAIGCGTGVPVFSDKAPFVVWSVGRNASELGIGVDEKQNGNGDVFFVSRDITGAGLANEFDDIVGWMSLHVLISRMLSAGQL